MALWEVEDDGMVGVWIKGFSENRKAAPECN